jgi:hypothetical protein
MIRIQTVSFANALALVSVGAYLLCLLLAAAVPDLFAAILLSWFHGTVAGTGAGVRVTAAGMLLGLLTVAAFAWLFGLALAALYNRLVRSRGETATGE